MTRLSLPPVLELRHRDCAAAVTDADGDPHRRLTLWADPAAPGAAWCAALADEGLVLTPAEQPDAAADAHLMLLHGSVVAQLPRLRQQREALPRAPLFVIARSLRDLDQVLALESGADDVVDAAVSAPVVAARLRALWRRASAAGSSPVAEPSALRFGALQLLGPERRVLLGGRLVDLSEAEFELLWLLASQAGRVVSRGDLLRSVRGLEPDPLDRSIDTRVYRIRAKLGGRARAGMGIRTVRNVGYAFAPRDW